MEGAEDIPYEIPNLFVGLHSPVIDVPVQWWRSVGHSHTAFVVESFLDEVASGAEETLSNSVAASSAGIRAIGACWNWPPKRRAGGKRRPPERARGIAVHESFGSFVAQVAEVSVTPAGKVRVHRVVCAVDCGRVVNPDTVEAQMESASSSVFPPPFTGPSPSRTAGWSRATSMIIRSWPWMRCRSWKFISSPARKAGRHRRAGGAPHCPGRYQCHLCRHRETDQTITHKLRGIEENVTGRRST